MIDYFATFLMTVLLKLKDENPELDPDETTDSPEFGQRLLKAQTGLQSLMSMKQSDIASKKDDNEPKKVCTLVEIQDACCIFIHTT